MKVFVKILILVLAVSCAIGGVMVYAKTKVEPPVSLKQTNQFLDDLNKCYKSIKSTSESHKEVDLLYLKTVDRIKIFQNEKKISTSESDKQYEILIDCYAPLFLKRCFSKFEKSNWIEKDHEYMLIVLARLKSVRHSDNTPVLSKAKADSLALVNTIIKNYRIAKTISHKTYFDGINNAQRTISDAKQYASDAYLSKCTSLRNALNNVRTSIANSHYNYIQTQVEKLSQYRYYGKDYYENSLIPMVDECVTKYDQNAKSLYGTKKDVEVLWNRARAYYNEASNYYNQDQF